MLYTIYKITNNLNGKIYIGKHQTIDPNDSYFGSGKAIVAAFRKHGKVNFTKEILFIFETEEEMNSKEREIITEEFVNRVDTYNLGIGGEGGPHFKGRKHSEESRIKMRNVWENEEYRATKIEVGKRVGAMSRGRKLSDKARENIRNGVINRFNNSPMAEEARKKISEGVTAYYAKTSKEDRKHKKKRKCRPHSEATKEKLRLRALERWNRNKTNFNITLDG